MDAGVYGRRLRGPALGRASAGSTVSENDTHNPAALKLDEVYEEFFGFVWRSAQRLGVPKHALDDLVQDVFVIVHRKFQQFEGRSSLKTWLYAITVRVVRDYRRTLSRKKRPEPLNESDVQSPAPSPLEAATQAEATAALRALLEELDDDKREVLVLVELEQMTVPQVAEAIGINVNTVYSRLRSARVAFNSAVAKFRERQRVPRPTPSACGETEQEKSS